MAVKQKEATKPKHHTLSSYAAEYSPNLQLKFSLKIQYIVNIRHLRDISAQLPTVNFESKVKKLFFWLRQMH